MRQVINKLITEEDLYSAVDAAFSQGWRRVKLYFLIGLPTERDEDVIGYRRARQALRRDRTAPCEIGDRGRLGGRISCPSRTRPSSGSARTRSTSCSARSICSAKHARTTRGLTIRWHEPAASAAEGVASRGDRRMGAVIERVWRAGGTFQEWSERFDLALWEDALAAEGLSLAEVAYRDRDEHEPLPWDHISAGLHRDFLWTDWQDALAEAVGRGLPLDALLRLRGLHRLRAGARGRLGRAAGGRESGDGSGSFGRAAGFRSGWSAACARGPGPGPRPGCGRRRGRGRL